MSLERPSPQTASLVAIAQKGRDMVALCETDGYKHRSDLPLADSRAGDLMWEMATALDEAASTITRLEQERDAESNEVVLLILDLAERVHEGHHPADPNLRHLTTPFEECRASICERARNVMAELDGPQTPNPQKGEVK